MSDVYEHNPGDHEDPQGGATWLVGIVGTVLFIIIIMGVTALLKATVAETTDAVIIATEPVELQQVLERDQKRLYSDPRVIEYVDVDGNEQTRIAIPIDRAIELTAEQYSAGSAAGGSASAGRGQGSGDAGG